jgi:hypothetical protein
MIIEDDVDVDEMNAAEEAPPSDGGGESGKNDGLAHSKEDDLSVDELAESGEAPSAKDTDSEEESPDADNGTPDPEGGDYADAPPKKGVGKSDEGDDATKEVVKDGDEGHSEKRSPEETLRKRLADAQTAFHKSRNEIKRAEERLREREERIAELESRLKGVVKVDDSVPADILDELPEESREILADTPGLMPLVKMLLDKASKSVTPDAVIEKIAKTKEHEDSLLREEKEARWQGTILAHYDDFFEVRESREFQDWVQSNIGTVKAILSAHDDLDPMGSIKLRRAYDLAKSSQQSKSSKNKATHSLPHENARGTARTTTGNANSDVPKTRSQLEAEAMAAIYEEDGHIL